MNFALLLGKEMRVALELECGSTSDGERERKETLERYDDLFPFELAARAAVDAAGRLGEPAVRDILRAELAVVATLFQPGSVNEKPLWEKPLHLV
jgi:hypothetical protein